MRIGVLGGTFDPIHEGHLAMARAARGQFGLDKVLFVPALIPPHKINHRDLAPAPYRYAMIEIAIQNEPAFEVSKIELDRPEISYTVETLRLLKQQYGGDQIYLLLGADSMAEIPTWKEPEEIRRLARFLVAPRGGDDLSRIGRGVDRINMALCPIASSEIRRRIGKGESVKDMLSGELIKYIRQKKLYGAKG